jgi:talin
MKDIGISLKSFTHSIKTDIAEPNELTIMQIQNELDLVKESIVNVKETLRDHKNTELPQILKASEKIETVFLNLPDSITAAKQSQSAVSNVDLDGKRLIKELEGALDVEDGRAYGEIAQNISIIYESIVGSTSSAIVSYSDNAIKMQLTEQVRELGGTAMKSVNMLRKKQGVTEEMDSSNKKAINDCLKELTFKIEDLNKMLTDNSEVLVASKNLTDGVEAIVTELETSLIFAEAKQLDPVGERTNFRAHKEDILLGSQKLTEGNKKLVGNASLSTTETAIIFESSLSSVKVLTSAAIKGALCLTSSKSELQERLLNLAKDIGESTLALAIAYQNNSPDSKMVPSFKDCASNQLVGIKAIVDAVREIGAEAESGNQDVQDVINAIDASIAVLASDNPALGSAIPSEVIALAKQIAGATASLVSGNSNSEDVSVALNKLSANIQDITRAGKAAVNGAPEAQRKEMVDAVIKLATSCKQLVKYSTEECALPLLEKKKQLNVSVKAVSTSVTEVVKAASSLVPAGYVDPNDPNVIAERELLSAANSIEAAARKLALLRPSERPREANEDLNFEEQIVEGKLNLT